LVSSYCNLQNLNLERILIIYIFPVKFQVSTNNIEKEYHMGKLTCMYINGEYTYLGYMYDMLNYLRKRMLTCIYNILS
jgi:hypothetical protein